MRDTLTFHSIVSKCWPQSIEDDYKKLIYRGRTF